MNTIKCYKHQETGLNYVIPVEWCEETTESTRIHHRYVGWNEGYLEQCEFKCLALQCTSLSNSDQTHSIIFSDVKKM